MYLVGDTQSEKPARYDAFILYADEDSDFALQIVDKMENEYNLKVKPLPVLNMMNILCLNG